VGRKKIRIERIADERNRQVRSRTDRPLTPRAFGGRTRESSQKALVSPRETFRTRVEPTTAFPSQKPPDETLTRPRPDVASTFTFFTKTKKSNQIR
jgi:hypothetical protein